MEIKNNLCEECKKLTGGACRTHNPIVIDSYNEYFAIVKYMAAKGYKIKDNVSNISNDLRFKKIA